MYTSVLLRSTITWLSCCCIRVSKLNSLSCLKPSVTVSSYVCLGCLPCGLKEVQARGASHECRPLLNTEELRGTQVLSFLVPRPTCTGSPPITFLGTVNGDPGVDYDVIKGRFSETILLSTFEISKDGLSSFLKEFCDITETHIVRNSFYFCFRHVTTALGTSGCERTYFHFFFYGLKTQRRCKPLRSGEDIIIFISIIQISAIINY